MVDQVRTEKHEIIKTRPLPSCGSPLLARQCKASLKGLSRQEAFVRCSEVLQTALRQARDHVRWPDTLLASCSKRRRLNSVFISTPSTSLLDSVLLILSTPALWQH